MIDPVREFLFPPLPDELKSTLLEFRRLAKRTDIPGPIAKLRGLALVYGVELGDEDGTRPHAPYAVGCLTAVKRDKLPTGALALCTYHRREWRAGTVRRLQTIYAHRLNRPAELLEADLDATPFGHHAAELTAVHLASGRGVALSGGGIARINAVINQRIMWNVEEFSLGPQAGCPGAMVFDLILRPAEGWPTGGERKRTRYYARGVAGEVWVMGDSAVDGLGPQPTEMESIAPQTA